MRRGFSIFVLSCAVFGGGFHAAGDEATAGDWQSVKTPDGVLAVHPDVEWKSTLPQGPFVRLGDGGILGVSGTNVLVSHDEGETWETRPLFAPDQDLKVSSERAMVRTANGTIVLVFMNMTAYTWKWNAEKSLPEPDSELDVWSIRSVDDGKTWIDAQKIYDGYCGDVHSMIQTSQGTLITPVQELMYEDGRHALRPRYSTDDGKTWHRSNFLDIGGRGHHDGLIEGTLTELRDGRVWLLCRTNLGQFWSAYSGQPGRRLSRPATFRHPREQFARNVDAPRQWTAPARVEPAHPRRTRRDTGKPYARRRQPMVGRTRQQPPRRTVRSLFRRRRRDVVDAGCDRTPPGRVVGVLVRLRSAARRNLGDDHAGRCARGV